MRTSVRRKCELSLVVASTLLCSKARPAAWLVTAVGVKLDVVVWLDAVVVWLDAAVVWLDAAVDLLDAAWPLTASSAGRGANCSSLTGSAAEI